MQTLNHLLRNAFPLWLVLVASLLAGCGKDSANEATDSDANGYVCLKCETKLYTHRTVFLGPKCPTCNEEKLISVVGYFCEKDKHLTLRPSRNDPQGAPVCEVCKAPLQNAMRMPREADLKSWGAKKTQ